jgi:hypothetical protein
MHLPADYARGALRGIEHTTLRAKNSSLQYMNMQLDHLETLPRLTWAKATDDCAT